MLALGEEMASVATHYPVKGSKIKFERMLQSQGFGSRKYCRSLIESGRVTVNGQLNTNPQAELETTGLYFVVDGVHWDYRDKVYLLLHKPSGYECSRNPQHHPSVLSLLPNQLLERGIQCVGRLDEDTTGLLLLTDDGPWLHQLTHPKRHVPKRYLITLKHPCDAAQLEALRDGVLLHGETELCRAQDLEVRSEKNLAMTIEQGKYHQVKRMLAAAGNRVQALHRERFGQLTLGALQAGEWVYLDQTQRQLAACLD